MRSEISCASRIRSISSSVRYSVLAAAGRGTARRIARNSAKLAFARRCILFSEESFEHLIPDVNGFVFGFVQRLALIEVQGLSNIAKLADMPSQCDLEVFESSRFAMSIA